MVKPFWLASILIAAIHLTYGLESGAAEFGIASGSGSFPFIDEAHERAVPITVWTYLPEALPADAPIGSVMHGTLRKGKSYRDNWIEHARKYRFLLITPEFPEWDYPIDAYQHGNVLDARGEPNPPAKWIYYVIERLFDR